MKPKWNQNSRNETRMKPKWPKWNYNGRNDTKWNQIVEMEPKWNQNSRHVTKLKPNWNLILPLKSIWEIWQNFSCTFSDFCQQFGKWLQKKIQEITFWRKFSKLRKLRSRGECGICRSPEELCNSVAVAKCGFDTAETRLRKCARRSSRSR